MTDILLAICNLLRKRGQKSQIMLILRGETNASQYDGELIPGLRKNR